MNRHQSQDDNADGMIWQGFLISHNENASESNYEYTWNKWKKKSQQRNRGYIEEPKVNGRTEKNTVTEIKNSMDELNSRMEKKMRKRLLKMKREQ